MITLAPFVLYSPPDRRRPQFRISISIRMLPQLPMPPMVVSSQPENGLNWMIITRSEL